MDFESSSLAEDWNQPPPDDPTLLQASVGDPMADEVHVLRFAFFGCEPKVPYGPIRHTAELFLDLLSQVALSSREKDFWILTMKTYDCQQQVYPTDWDSFDGYILPGSFSSAYDSDKWIEKLKDVIQKELVAQERPTLGVCFGHQILAHSFADGRVVAVPTGARVGPCMLSCSKEGKEFLERDSLSMLVTHGDMVEKLPSRAVGLGGDDKVPIQAALYLKSQSDNMKKKVFAVTFQAHPEFSSSRDLGLLRTHHLITDVMHSREAVSREVYDAARRNADECFEMLHKNSIDSVLTAARLLGWFP